MKKIILIASLYFLLAPLPVKAQSFDQKIVPSESGFIVQDKKIQPEATKAIQQSSDVVKTIDNSVLKQVAENPEICIWRDASEDGFYAPVRECHSQQEVCDVLHQYENVCSDGAPQACRAQFENNSSEATVIRNYSRFCHQNNSSACIESLQMNDCSSNVMQYNSGLSEENAYTAASGGEGVRRLGFQSQVGADLLAIAGALGTFWHHQAVNVADQRRRGVAQHWRKPLHPLFCLPAILLRHKLLGVAAKAGLQVALEGLGLPDLLLIDLKWRAPRIEPHDGADIRAAKTSFAFLFKCHNPSPL